MNGADWSKRYPRVVEEAARIKGHAIIDAEVVCLDRKGVAQFELLHNRSNDGAALALGFDLCPQRQRSTQAPAGRAQNCLEQASHSVQGRHSVR